MPNDVLIDRILALVADSRPSERLVLKLAAAVIKQLDEDNYDIRQDADARIKLSGDEFDWLPDLFEVWNGIPRPKHWATPERLAAVQREKREIAAIREELSLDHAAAIMEYIRRQDERRK